MRQIKSIFICIILYSLFSINLYGKNSQLIELPIDKTRLSAKIYNGRIINGDLVTDISIELKNLIVLYFYEVPSETFIDNNYITFNDILKSKESICYIGSWKVNLTELKSEKKYLSGKASLIKNENNKEIQINIDNFKIPFNSVFESKQIAQNSFVKVGNFKINLLDINFIWTQSDYFIYSENSYTTVDFPSSQEIFTFKDLTIYKNLSCFSNKTKTETLFTSTNNYNIEVTDYEFGTSSNNYAIKMSGKVFGNDLTEKREFPESNILLFYDGNIKANFDIIYTSINKVRRHYEYEKLNWKIEAKKIKQNNSKISIQENFVNYNGTTINIGPLDIYNNGIISQEEEWTKQNIEAKLNSKNDLIIETRFYYKQNEDSGLFANVDFKLPKYFGTSRLNFNNVKLFPDGTYKIYEQNKFCALSNDLINFELYNSTVDPKNAEEIYISNLKIFLPSVLGLASINLENFHATNNDFIKIENLNSKTSIWNSEIEINKLSFGNSFFSLSGFLKGPDYLPGTLKSKRFEIQNLYINYTNKIKNLKIVLNEENNFNIEVDTKIYFENCEIKLINNIPHIVIENYRSNKNITKPIYVNLLNGEITIN